MKALGTPAKSRRKMRKILILGSGGLRIGQAGEFDYSGSQAIKALREEGLKVVLINPNIATVQTSKGMADRIYFQPITVDVVEKIIAKERPNGILLSFGGQTALNSGVQLDQAGILAKYHVAVLGTPIKAIQETEDRDLFVQKLAEIQAKVPQSIAATTLDEAINAAQKIGYPVMVRIAYALGGRGSGFCADEEQLKQRCQIGFSSSPQVLVEEWLGGWKEIEYEVVRDAADNCLTVCNMENFDPLGIHTGESIVVAPSQTLSNREYHKLRAIAIKVVRHLGIVGECNVQFALSATSEDYRIIEVNARLSRSSALASKATGYPLAFIATKLALGHLLCDLPNSITKKTTSFFEPALDYVVVKVPRWDLKKFKEVDPRLGSEMKSVGEVMSIGRSFEEALQKALRMINTGMHGLSQNRMEFGDLEAELRYPTDKRIFAIGEALKRGMTVERIHEITAIDTWFLEKLKNIVDLEKPLAELDLSPAVLRKAKEAGYSDYQIAKIRKTDLDTIRKQRLAWNIRPWIKQIDTLAGEFPAQTNYLYLTYHGTENDISPGQDAIIILGSGAYRIGSSVEFDWCCVNAVATAKKLGVHTIMINYNPETVSTDYDVCDRLYFDELTLERILDIYDFEKPRGVIVSMGGQIPNNLAMRLYQHNVNILGTHPKNIDRAEDRHKFSQLLDELKVDQPPWAEVASVEDSVAFANKVGYPVLIRPSYVLSGHAMNVVWNDHTLQRFLKEAADVNPQSPVVVTKFIENAKEIEIDAVAKEGDILIYAISEHVENAGVHSGDATLMLPAQRLYIETIRKVKKISRQIAKALNITGPFNIQFLAQSNQIKVIECNLRASRSFPFCSKVFKKNMIEMATKAILGAEVRPVEKSSLDLDYVGVKAAQFSFSRLKGADPMLGVEMASTGEVGCLGHDLNEAFLQAVLSVGLKIPRQSILLSAGPLESKARFLESALKLQKLGIKIYATMGTAEFLEKNGIPCTTLYWPTDQRTPNAYTYLESHQVEMVINITKGHGNEELQNDYIIRRAAVDFEIPLITNLQVAMQMVDSLEAVAQEGPPKILAWEEY
ncbi:MAG: carbamoyl-phosphate synthase (glutamine-hydrolyzing) large subunit [Bacteriovoracaceae bacterium]|nr:carbamoyl-phosphate synthase (glutamine-hydrolyzing) large subunit [Bacteriovoracaceae bacterium]